MSDDLPTITYTTESGERQRIDYQRDPRDPTNVWRVVQQFDTAADEWRPVGKEPLDELAVDGEHRMPRAVGLR